MCQRNEDMNHQISNNNPKFEIGQLVMFKNHAHHTFEPKYLLDYRVLKILNDSSLLLVTPNGKERKTNINDVKPCNTSELIENVWDSWDPSKVTIKTVQITLDLDLNFGQQCTNDVLSIYFQITPEE